MSDSAASEPTTAEPQGVVGEVTTLIIALALMWMAPFVLHRLMGMQFIGMANVTAFAAASAVWAFYGPGAWPLRAAWSIAGPLALLWFSCLLIATGTPPIRQEEAAFVILNFGCIWLVQLAVCGLVAWIGWPFYPSGATISAQRTWQFGLADLLGLMIPFSLIFALGAQVATIPYREGWFTGWGGGIIIGVLFFLGHIVQIVVVASLATWSASRGVKTILASVAFAVVVSAVYALIAGINNGGPVPILFACASFFAFTWCSARLLYRVREVTMGGTVSAEQAADEDGVNDSREPRSE